MLLGLKAFVAAVIGGIGNVRGAVLGGFVIAFVEQFGSLLLGRRLSRRLCLRAPDRDPARSAVGSARLHCARKGVAVATNCIHDTGEFGSGRRKVRGLLRNVFVQSAGRLAIGIAIAAVLQLNGPAPNVGPFLRERLRPTSASRSSWPCRSIS